MGERAALRVAAWQRGDRGVWVVKVRRKQGLTVQSFLQKLGRCGDSGENKVQPYLLQVFGKDK